jgi:hypothetical protein
MIFPRTLASMCLVAEVKADRRYWGHCFECGRQVQHRTHIVHCLRSSHANVVGCAQAWKSSERPMKDRTRCQKMCSYLLRHAILILLSGSAHNALPRHCACVHYFLYCRVLARQILIARCCCGYRSQVLFFKSKSSTFLGSLC